MMTINEINMAEELTEKLRNQGELIAKVLCGMTGSDYFKCVELLPSPEGDRGIAITIHSDDPGAVWTRVEWFPEEYLSKSEDELVNELNRRREEEKRRKEAEELVEKEVKEREEEEARKKRYQMFLELSAEFGEPTLKPKDDVVDIPTNESVLKWAKDVQNKIKRYDFNMVDPKNPSRIASVSNVEVVGIDVDSGVPWVITKDGSYYVDELTPNCSDKYMAWGVFTSEDRAIAASTAHFNAEKEKTNKLKELKEQKEELEKQIKELEEKLS